MAERDRSENHRASTTHHGVTPARPHWPKVQHPKSYSEPNCSQLFTSCFRKGRG